MFFEIALKRRFFMALAEILAVYFLHFECAFFHRKFNQKAEFSTQSLCSPYLF